MNVEWHHEEFQFDEDYTIYLPPTAMSSVWRVPLVRT